MPIDVSIIMPVYKSASSLSRCLESILAQDFEGTYEVILCIDDSGDGSLDICSDYAKRYPGRFVCHHPDHRMGLSLARQEGFDLAKGVYIYSCDADDELRHDALRVLVDTIREYDADFVNCSFYTAKGSKEHARVNFFRVPTRCMNKVQAFACFMNDASFRGFLWTKLFKASLLKKYPRIVIQKKGVMFEDAAFVTWLLSHCERVVNIPTPLYYYYQDNPDSAVNTSHADRAHWHVAIFAAIRIYLDRLGDQELIKVFRRKKMRMMMTLYFDMSIDKKAGFTKKDKAECLEAMKLVLGKEPLDPAYPYIAEYVEGAILEGR